MKLRDDSLVTSTSMMVASIIHPLEDIYALVVGFVSVDTPIIRNMHTNK